MKIQNGNLAGLGGAGNTGRTNAPNPADAVGRGGKGGAARSEKTADGDSIQLSSLSQELRVEQSDSPEREERIDQLRAQVRSGTYQADPVEVGRAIIKDAVDSKGLGGE